MKHNTDCNSVWIGEIRGSEMGVSEWLIKMIERHSVQHQHSCLRSQSCISIGTIRNISPITIRK